MMREISEDLFEYERPAGRLQLLLHRLRWTYILVGVMGLAFAIPFLISHLASPAANLIASSETDEDLDLWQSALSMSPSLTSSSSPGRKAVSKAVLQLQYKFSGINDPALVLTNFSDFSGLSSRCVNESLLTSVSLQNVNLDAEQFSKSLQGCVGLQAISLENVWLIGNFSRVHLPNLSRFFYRQNGNDKRDSYKSPETLQQTLFFDKDPSENGDNSIQSSPSWNVERDLLNLGVDITLWKAGTKLIDIQRPKGEIYLNVKYCESVLVNVKGSFDSLTLINCNVTAASIPVIPPTLKYLNLRNAVQRTPTLAELTDKLQNLEEFYLWLTFHCDWPGYELFLNLSSLPPSLQKLGTNNVDAHYVPGAPLPIKQLTVGDYITNTVVSDGLPQLFQGLQQINIVNISDPTPAAGYAILRQAIQMRVKTIAVVNLRRNYTATENANEILEVETLLENAGLPKKPLSCFILQLSTPKSPNSSASYKGRELSENERHQIRYAGLGFDKMDLLADYLKWDSLQ